MDDPRAAARPETPQSTLIGFFLATGVVLIVIAIAIGFVGIIPVLVAFGIVAVIVTLGLFIGAFVKLNELNNTDSGIDVRG